MKTLFLLVGPTCTGKSTLEKWLNVQGMPSLRSFTTRAPRTGEVDGVDYDFLPKADVQVLFDLNKIVQSVNFNGNFYGTTSLGLDLAFKSSDRAVVVVEPTGVIQFKQYAMLHDPDLNIVSVYLDNELDTLVERLVARYKGDKKADPMYYWTRLVGQLEEKAAWSHFPGIKWDIYLHEHEDRLIGGRASTARAGNLILSYRSRK